MKYEMIFGDERLFDGASEFVEVIRFNDYSREYLWGDLNTIQLLTFRELKAIPIVAMRRIIADHKRWTVEDQKAGRLREEWCNKALSSCSILSGMQKYELKRLGGYIEDIYDALLSGDLSTPVQAKDGE